MTLGAVGSVAWHATPDHHAVEAGRPVRGGGPAARRPDPPAGSAAPSKPRAVCGVADLLTGPASPPPQAVVVPAGLDRVTRLEEPGATYWFAPGRHTFGSGQYTHVTPGDHASYLGAPGAVISGLRVNDFAFAGVGSSVTIEYLTIQGFMSPADQGVVNHTGAQGWTIEHDTVRTNPVGAGVVIGSHDRVEYDCLTRNGEYGFNGFTTAVGPTLSHDEISFNDGSGAGGGRYDQGGTTISCGCSGGGKFWRAKNAVVTTNWIHDNGSVGLWVDTDNRGFDIARNFIAHNYAEGIMYEISYNARIADNTLVGNAWGRGIAVSGFPVSGIYISESGGDPRVKSDFSGSLRITGNVLRTNWGGVVLWENSNRYCGDGSDHVCTLVTPATYTLESCSAHVHGSRPAQRPDYYGGCRWKTRTVTVSRNVFTFTPKKIPRCTVKHFCGFNGLFSEYGSTAPWSGWVVPLHIADRQHNHFEENRYTGPWHFDGFNQGDVVTWRQWAGGFTDWTGSHDRFRGQDQGSTLRP